MQARTSQLKFTPFSFECKCNDRKRRRAAPQTMTASIEQRRERIPPKIWAYLLKIAYNEIPANETLKNVERLINDIGEELLYLRKIGKTEEDREKQRCIAAIGLQQTKLLELEEEKAHAYAQDIDSSSSQEEENTDDNNQDLEDLVVSDHASGDEQEYQGMKRLCAPQKQKKIVVNNEEDID